MGEKLDEGRFRALLVASDDLQSDAMNGARRDLNAYVEAAQEARHESRPDLCVGGAALGTGALGLAALAFASPAIAAGAQDVMALQTAAGLENLAVFTYQTALALPFIGGSSANAVVKAFAIKTMAQHEDHGKAFNAAARRLGGKHQSATDPKYTPVVQAAAREIRGPEDVVSLAIKLEDIAAQTYVKDVGLVSTADLRGLFASVAGVEAQHKAILLAVQALLEAGAAQLVALPPDLAAWPGPAGGVGFPDAFFPSSEAAPVGEGALK